MIAAVKIRGSIDAREKTSRTLETLGLRRKFQAQVMEDNDSNHGMLKKAKDYIAYGKISEETAEKLKQRDTVNLSPPSGGLKSSKKQYHQGGSLGKRDDMDELLEKML